MDRFFSTVCRVFVCFALLLLVSCTFGERSSVGPGDTAPSFKLQSLRGVSHELAQYRGKVVLINFWASWCAPCVSEMPSLEHLYQKLKGEGLEVLAIGIDDEETNLRIFKDKFSLTFPVLYDRYNKTKELYNVRGVPESFVLGRDGKFIMIPDLDDNQPVIRITGPRDWDSPNAISRFRKLLKP